MGQGLRSDERKVQAGGVPMLLESKYRVNAGLKMNYLTFYLIVNKLLSLSLWRPRWRAPPAQALLRV